MPSPENAAGSAAPAARSVAHEAWREIPSVVLASERVHVAALRTRVAALRTEVEALEARVNTAGPAAATWPEDLGEWGSSSARMQGLVTRVVQTAELAATVRQLRAACSRAVE